MRLSRNILVVAALLSLFAISAFAQVSQEFKDWSTGPATWLMTEEEKTSWKNVKSDADARALVDLFWARRDPTPGTPANEFRDEYNSRVEFADRQFAEGRKKGSMTERGRMIVILGAPTRISRLASDEQAGQSGVSGMQNAGARQIWIYEQAKTKYPLATTSAQIVFLDQYKSGVWSYERTAVANDLQRRALNFYMTQPGLTEAPSMTAQAAPAATAQLPAPTPLAPAAMTAFKTESLRTAVTEFKSAKTNPYNNKVAVTFTELVSPAGDFYVPVQLYIPKSAGLTAESVTTFFGVVEDAAGNTVAVFEEPATLSASKGDLYFDRSLTLQPGTYRATLGLSAADGKPVVMSTTAMDLKPFGKDTKGISRLILANDIHETEQAALAGAPYAFGRVKIVPKGDRVFTNKDEINYFLEVMNPSIDETSNAPKLQVKLDLIQSSTGGKPGRTISAPLSDASPLPLTGQAGAGQYAILAGIPLGQMKNPLPAGDYTLRVKVIDQVTKENWTAEQKLTLVAAPADSASK
jgi:GWxTD domain-containing protein